MADTSIRPHSCTTNKSGCPDAADYQNTRYGRGMRVFNHSMKKGVGKAYCTVCGDSVPL